MSGSQIAQLRRQIQAEYESAQSGLSGLASGVARHDFITARTENLVAIHEQLVSLVGPDAAIAILAQTIWTPEEQGRV